MFCFLISPIANVGHRDLALKSSVNSVVNTSWLAPVTLDFDIAIRLITDELFGQLFNNIRFNERPQSWHCNDYLKCHSNNTLMAGKERESTLKCF